MRGKVAHRAKHHAAERITPAYAGKSVERKGENPFDLDHPRLCGEKQLPFGFLLLLPGSPPPMRGKAAKKSATQSAGQDHPRLCGEKSQIPLKNSPIPGSPPPMRGKVTVSSSSRVMIGITPAYAGKSVATLYSLVKVQDHPRLCGEKGKPGVLVTEEQGSPPPMRGKAALSGYDCTAGGITPAYAGKR